MPNRALHPLSRKTRREVEVAVVAGFKKIFEIRERNTGYANVMFKHLAHDVRVRDYTVYSFTVEQGKDGGGGENSCGSRQTTRFSISIQEME